MNAATTKKTILATLLLPLALHACVAERPADCPAELRFGISLADGFSLNPATRAPIYSAQAVQSIADVRIHAFRTYDGGGTFRYIRSWNISPRWSPGSMSTTLNVPSSEMVDPGNYRFLAVGMDSPADYSLPQLTPSNTLYSTVAATLATAPPAAQEIFSGYTFRVIAAGANNIEIVMTRRVAGALLYVSNIPTAIGTQPTAYLRLTLARSNTMVDITSRVSDAVAPAPASQPGYNIFDIDLRGQGDANNDGLWDGSPAIAGVTKLPTTTLAGAYILPAMANAADGGTLTLSLVAADGTTRLRSWAVRDPTSNTSYGILPNCLYSIGRKLQTSDTTDDAPIDLSRSQSLTATADPDWGTTSQMVIEQI
jgi:hypothetical protein